MQNLSGIPILLTFKVTPANGYAIPTKFSVNTPQEISRYQTTLQTFLEETFDYITAEIAATFKQKTDLEQYFISFTKIISKPGHDTKYTIKPFLKYLDSEKQLSLQINGTKFSFGLTSRVLIWHATEVCVDHYFRILKSDGSTIYIFPQIFVIYICSLCF